MVPYRTSMRVVFASVAITLAALVGPAWADVGTPMGAGAGNTFGIKITQGATTIVDRADVPFPADIRTDDGSPESYVVLGHVNAGTDYIIKAVSNGPLMQSWRNVAWYIDSIKPGDIHRPGTTSLFAPSNLYPIDVEIYNVKFAYTSTATPLLGSWPQYYVSFMRNEPGHFYNSFGAGTYNQNGWGQWDVQVRGNTYMDATTSQYSFTASPGGVVSWKWRNILAPGTTTTVVDTSGAYHLSDEGGTQKGFVHELGLGMSATGVPEPATLVLLALSPLVLRRRRGC